MAATKVRRINTPKFRVSYQHIWTPQENDDGSKVYSVTMIFDKDADLDEMNEILDQAANKKWGNQRPRKMNLPWKDGTEYYLDNEKKNPEYKGKIICSASSYEQPVAVTKLDRRYEAGDPRRIVDITDQSEFYSGCFAVAAITAFGYEKKGKKGVSFGLQNIIKVGNGDPLVKFANPQDDFCELDDSMFDDDDDDDLGDLF